MLSASPTLGRTPGPRGWQQYAFIRRAVVRGSSDDWKDGGRGQTRQQGNEARKGAGQASCLVLKILGFHATNVHEGA